MQRWAAAGLVPLALVLVGCSAGGRPSYTLPPLGQPATSTTVPQPLETRPTLPSSVGRRTTTTALGVLPAPLGSAATGASARTGVSVRLPGATKASSGGTATVPGAVARQTTPAAGTTPAPAATASPTTTVWPPLQVIAPTGRALPEGPFDVLVSGASAFVLTAQPAAVCSLDAGRVVPLGPGDCTVKATAPGYADAQAAVHIRRGDPTVSWQFGSTTAFTYNTLTMDLRSSSGGGVRATAASGTCKLANATSISFAVVTSSGAPQLGACTVTAAVDETPQWNAATATLATTTTRAPVTVAVDVPATSATSSFVVRAVLTQGDRSLDTLLSFSADATGTCSLGAGASLPDPSTRTATIRVSGTGPASGSGWCAVRLRTDAAGPASVVSFTTPGCRWIWIGKVTPVGPKPACP